jgi:hypothetical protein
MEFLSFIVSIMATEEEESVKNQELVPPSMALTCIIA